MMEFNFCFICLTELKIFKEVEVRRRKKREPDRNMEARKSTSNLIGFLAKYLLQSSEKTYDPVLKGILQFTEVKTDNRRDKGEECSRSLLKLCEKCELATGRLLERHLELEKLQMQIIHEVKSIRKAVLRSSGWLGGSGVGSKPEEAFEHFSRKFCNKDFSNNMREIFDSLKAFQDAVKETDTASILVPLVLLEKFLSPLPQPLIGSTFLEPDIKVEPISQDDDTFPVEDHGNCGLNFEENIFSEDVFVGENEVNKLDLETDAENMKTESNLDDNVKEEHHPHTPKKCSISNPRSRRRRRHRLNPIYRKKKEIVAVARPDDGLQRVSGRYFCHSCGDSYKLMCRFEQHLREHETEEKPIQCDQCDQGFSTQQYYTLHRGRHKGRHKLTCHVCQNRISAFDLPVHMNTHSDFIIQCSHCSNCFTSAQAHMTHIRLTHVAIDLKCELCGLSVPSKAMLSEHLRDVHNEDGMLKCDFKGCGKSFHTRNGLHAHKVFHTAQFTCRECYRSFTSQKKLESHQLWHTGQQERSFKCDQCPKAFLSDVTLQSHLIRDHEGESFKCGICDKGYVTEAGLKLHIMEHDVNASGKRKQCPKCNSTFVNEARLKRHMRIHADTKNYVCEECGKSFKTIDLCRIHKAIHGEKKHQCPHCPKVFHKSQYLVQHIRTHTGEKPYQCDSCGKAFSQPGSVKIHRKKCSLQSSSRESREATFNS